MAAAARISTASPISIFTCNGAIVGGGAVFNAVASVTGTTFSNNEADDFGGDTE